VKTIDIYTCPVCGFSRMPHPPQDYNLCPCCGTEFGLDDTECTHAELRAAWLQRGAPWFSEAFPPEPTWNPYVQLVLADLDYDQRYEPESVENTYSRFAAIA
jgi:hypothetical protein